ncbi:hypothetical protein [Bradyrhizobium sp. SYSU BS000235]|uniref:hypothetical protein n=1 Tax=Bradyrhizobium sp. SYSU BS000235 TaxID=3411332 RepID=UPI003C7278F4
MVGMFSSRASDRVIEPMIALAKCSQQDQILIAGAKAIELMLDMHWRGYVHAAATANCGRPAGQYDVTLVDWRRRPFRTLEQTLDWLLNYLNPRGTLLIWVDPQKPAAIQNIHLALEKRGLVVEADMIHECGCAVSARRRETAPLRKAA